MLRPLRRICSYLNEINKSKKCLQGGCKNVHAAFDVAVFEIREQKYFFELNNLFVHDSFMLASDALTLFIVFTCPSISVVRFESPDSANFARLITFNVVFAASSHSDRDSKVKLDFYKQ